MISDKEKKSRQTEKELKSLRNKMGSNILWFDSLHIVLKYDLLFAWKAEKYTNKLTQPKKEKVIKFTRVGWKAKRQKVEVINYPPNLKYFIQKIKTHPRFKVNVIDHRNAAIEILLNKK
jgi:hypothetical protein